MPTYSGYYIYTCPFCGRKAKQNAQMSGNSSGAVYFSDMSSYEPMGFDSALVAQCGKCGKYYLLTKPEHWENKQETLREKVFRAEIRAMFAKEQARKDDNLDTRLLSFFAEPDESVDQETRENLTKALPLIVLEYKTEINHREWRNVMAQFHKLGPNPSTREWTVFTQEVLRPAVLEHPSLRKQIRCKMSVAEAMVSVFWAKVRYSKWFVRDPAAALKWINSVYGGEELANAFHQFKSEGPSLSEKEEYAIRLRMLWSDKHLYAGNENAMALLRSNLAPKLLKVDILRRMGRFEEAARMADTMTSGDEGYNLLPQFKTAIAARWRAVFKIGEEIPETQQTEEANRRICPKCGCEILRPDAIFCRMCGCRLEHARAEKNNEAVHTPLPTAFLDTPDISSLLFHPRQCDAANELAPMSVTVPGAELGGFWFDNPGSDDVVLFFHGNGEVAADWTAMASDYAAAFDASVWFIDYRGYGRSTGVPTYGRMLEDAETAFSALSDREAVRGKPFRRRYVFGRSIGSAPAIHLAWRFPDWVDALVIDSGFSRVTELIRRFREMREVPGGAPLAPDGFLDNVDKLRSCGMPTLLIHGVVDKLIPVSEARENFEASAASEKRLVEIPGAGHNDLLFKSRLDGSYFGAIRNLR